jgi:hypothetical protein
MLLLLLSLSVTVLASVLGNIALGRYVKQINREHSREKMQILATNKELTDRIMHMAGSTWTPPPRPVVVEPEEDEELKRRLQEGWVDV